MPITRSRLTSYTWEIGFEDLSSGTCIRVMKAKENPDVAIIHEWAKTSGTRPAKGKVKIRYSVFGQKTDSPTDAIRRYNEEERNRAGGRRNVAGSPEQIAERKRAGC